MKKSILVIIVVAVFGVVISSCGSGFNQKEAAIANTVDAGVTDAGTPPDATTSDSSGSSKEVAPSEKVTEVLADAGASEQASNMEATQDGGTSQEVTVPEKAPEKVAEQVADAGSPEVSPEGSSESSPPEGQTSDSTSTDSAPANNRVQYKNRSNAPTWCKDIPKFSDYCDSTAPTDLGDPTQVKLIPHIKDSFYPNGKPEVQVWIVSWPSNGCAVVQQPLSKGFPKDCSGRYVNHFAIEVRHYDPNKAKYNYTLSGNKPGLMLAEPCYENKYLVRTPAQNGGTYHSDQATKATNTTYKECFGITLGVTKSSVPMIYHWNGRPLP